MMLAGLLLIQIGNPLRMHSLMSLGTAVIALASIFAFFVTFFAEQKMDQAFSKILILAIVSMFSMIIASQVNVSGLLTFLCFFEIPLFFYSYKELDSQRVKKAIYIVYFSLSVFYALASFGENAYILREGDLEYTVTSLTLGYGNPNEAAMYLFVCFAVLLSMLFDIRNKLFKVIIFLDLTYVANMLFQTESRTMVVALVAMVLLTLLFRRRSMPNPLVTLSFAMPLLFVFLLQRYGDVILLGERIETGRLEIFARVTEKMTIAKFFIGDYSFKFENLHNLYVSVFGTIGIVGVVAFALLLMQKIKYALKNATSKMNRIAAIGFLMLFVSSSTEAAVFTAGSAFAASAVTLYVLSILKEEEKDEDIAD